MKKLYYGVAYYDEYMPCERLDKDIEMMKEAGINLVRIAESTWSTLEPRPGVFDYSHIDRVLDKMYAAGIDVIVGTPTYAIPSWLYKMHPEIMADTKEGRRPYGARQIMDITSPAYLYYGERVIRKLISHVANHPAVIGYQIDNETKYYGTAGENVQRMFVRYLRDKFGTTDAMNKAFGFDYWSNRVDAWEDTPDVRGTINGSYAAEFEKFQRQLVTDYLAWQASIVREYSREDQFITHNLDFDFSRGCSSGVQPDVDHDKVAKCLDIAGCDIYHPTQMHLTGLEIAQFGDQIRSLKQAPYLVLETEAQGFTAWTPFPGQLRLQAVSHLASGAHLVEYWHWHSIHNAGETYWKGLLSHDFKPSAVYQEAKIIGNEFKKLSESLPGLHKENKAAILISNIALTSLKYFNIQMGMSFNRPGMLEYNDVVRWIYQALFKLNVGVDFIYADSLPEDADLSQYKLIAIPALYAAPESLLRTLLHYEENGGTLVATFKTAFADENVKVYHDEAPHLLSKAFGISYSQFTTPEGVTLSGIGQEQPADTFMELLIPDEDTETLSVYNHPYWKAYSAITHAKYGLGDGYYIGCHSTDSAIEALLKEALKTAEIDLPYAGSGSVRVRESIDENGNRVLFYLNYSPNQASINVPSSIDLLTDSIYESGTEITLPDWGYKIIRCNDK